MTGFGSAEGQVAGMAVSVEIRSVNHRFFTVRINVPDELTIYESAVERMVRAQVARGTVHVALSVAEVSSNGPQVDGELIARCFKTFSKIKRATGSKEPLEFEALLGLPFLWQGAMAPTGRMRQSWPRIEKLVGQALTQLVAMRDREGRAIRTDMGDRIGVIQQCVSRIADRAPQVETYYREKIVRKLTEAVQQVQNGSSIEGQFKDIAQSIDKSDIAEEVQRLTHHLEQFRKALKSTAQIGRRLDFLTQEMLRETNTIASKAADCGITDETIEMKSQLERIKEQVENVE